MGKKDWDNPWNGVRSTVSRWTSKHPPNPTRSGNQTRESTQLNDQNKTMVDPAPDHLSGTGRLYKRGCPDLFQGSLCIWP